METDLRNAVFHWLRSHGNNKQMVVRDEITNRESLDYLRKAQVTYILCTYIIQTSNCDSLEKLSKLCR